MATKKQADEGVNLIDTFAEFKQTKDIDRATLVSVLEESFRTVLAKQYGTDENYDVIINPDKGDFEIYRTRTVVPDGEVEDDNRQISLSEAQKIEADYELGEEVSQQLAFKDFGRRTILNLRQALASRILELEHDQLAAEYKDRIGTVVAGEVYQSWKRETLIIDPDNVEMLMPRGDQIPGEFFRKGDTVRGVIDRVENTGGTPKVIVSRTSPTFLLRLLEAEVPEIAEGIITVHNIARMPGERAKIAVESYDDRIDPVGACVGPRGCRVHGIVRELHGENIDVINYTANTELFIARALAPARINRIELFEAEPDPEHEGEMKKPHAQVYLDPDQVSLAIGKQGLNIKLAGMLTGYTIDVFRETNEEVEDDVQLDEFSDVIEPWIIDTFKGVGLQTARAVLAKSREMLIRSTDLEEETVDSVLHILAEEFRDDAPSDTHEEPAPQPEAEAEATEENSTNE